MQQWFVNNEIPYINCEGISQNVKQAPKLINFGHSLNNIYQGSKRRKTFNGSKLQV